MTLQLFVQLVFVVTSSVALSVSDILHVKLVGTLYVSFLRSILYWPQRCFIQESNDMIQHRRERVFAPGTYQPLHLRGTQFPRLPYTIQKVPVKGATRGRKKYIMIKI